MSASPLPTVNYLWKSPSGTVYTGFHHQLILHLLACESKWLKQEIDLNKIKAYLGMRYPQFMMDDVSLEAIGVEYLGLDRILRTAYRLVEPTVKVCRSKFNDGTSYEAVRLEPDIENFLHPALLEESEPSLFRQSDVSSSPVILSDSTAGTVYSDDELHELAQQIRRAKKSTHQSVTQLLSSAGNRSLGGSSIAKIRSQPAIFRPKTPNKPIPSSTASRPIANRFIDLYGLSPSASTNRSTDRSDNIPTQTGSIVKDVGKILFYAQSVHKARQQNQSITEMPPIRPVLQIVDGNTIDTSEMRLPDPTKYIQTSRNHYTIPASEAGAFCHWFEPSVDTVPDKIEGYLWYCDACYTPESEGLPDGKGRFNNKRSVQKHYESVHKATWTSVLPEPDRVAEIASETKARTTQTDAGAGEDQEDEHAQTMGASEQGTLISVKTRSISSTQGGEENGTDVEMCDAQDPREAVKEPTSNLRVISRSINETVMNGKK